MPGEKTYLVLDENGNALRPQSDLDDPAEVLSTTPTPWWSDAWDSVELAGHPPKPRQAARRRDRRVERAETGDP